MTALLLLAVLNGAAAVDHELELRPIVVQDIVLFLSDEVTAGGAGGGVGVELVYRRLFLAQLDVGALWMLGNALSTRLAVGAQHDGTWSPAGWLTLGALYGERTEFLAGDGRRPSIPSWSLGVRAAPLRFGGASGVFSALVPGIGIDFANGLWLELALIQLSLRL